MSDLVNETDNPLTGRFAVDADGAWHHDGEHITHERTWQCFSRSLRRDEKGVYYLTENSFRVDVEVADAPLVIRAIRETDAGLCVFFHDGADELLDPESLRFKGNVPYCTARENLSARFSSSAYAQLAELVRQDGDDFLLVIGNRVYRLPPQG